MVLWVICWMAIVTVITQALIVALKATADAGTLIKVLAFINVSYLLLITSILIVFMM